MLKEAGNTEKISSEIKVLRRQVIELRVIEQRCHQAEAALKSFEERNRQFSSDLASNLTGKSIDF